MLKDFSSSSYAIHGASVEERTAVRGITPGLAATIHAELD